MLLVKTVFILGQKNYKVWIRTLSENIFMWLSEYFEQRPQEKTNYQIPRCEITIQVVTK